MKYRKEIMQIHRLAVPILMNYALTSVFEIFDEMIIGHYSVESFAFVGVASSILYTITGAFGRRIAHRHGGPVSDSQMVFQPFRGTQVRREGRSRTYFQ